MTFNPSTGVYTPASGATTATAGQVIASATWNNIHTDFSTALTQLGQGTFAPPSTSLTLSNGLNSNITLPATLRAHITGPSGAFSIGGFTGGLDGRRIWLFNATAQTMTIVNEDSSSTAANRITTLNYSNNIVLQPNFQSFVVMSYDGTNSRWIVENANSLASLVQSTTSSLSLTNGLNSNIALPATSRVHITGPSGVFSIGGFANGVDGMRLYLFNSTSQEMTIVNEDASSTAANRITTLSGQNIILQQNTSFVTLSYDGTNSRWIVENVNGWNPSSQVPLNATSPGVGSYTANATNVNFGAAASDIASLSIALPPSAIGYQVSQLRIGNAQGSLSAVTVTLYTGAGATGTTVIGSTATTVTTSLPNSPNSMQVIIPASSSTVMWNAATLFLHISTSNSAASLADVTLEIKPMF